MGTNRWGGREPRGFLRRADLDGARVETLVDDVGQSLGIALDLHTGKMYWTERGKFDVPTGRIRRANLDGSNVEDLLANLAEPFGIALDLREGAIYWLSPTRGLEKARLDGTHHETIGAIGGFGLALDLIARKVYVAGFSLKRANLDGTMGELLVPHALADAAPGIALDLCGREPGGLRGDDHVAYLGCLIGPGAFAPTSCHCSDFSGDAHVDLKDFALLQRAYLAE